jgi:two-component system, cell cycle response regulator
MSSFNLAPATAGLVRLGGALLAVAFLGYAVQTLVPVGAEAGAMVSDGWLYNSLLLGAAAACAARAVLVRKERLVWALMGVALAVWTGGEIYYSLAFAESEAPTPSPADLGYLSFYLFAYASLILLVRSRFRGFSSAQWLDGIVVGSAVAALAAALAIEPILAVGTSGSSLEVITNLAYPIADLTLLSLVITVAALSGWRPGFGWALLGAGLVVLAITDGLYLLQFAQGTYVEGGLLEVTWPLGALLLAAAAWSPTPSEAQAAQPRGLRTILIPAAAALTAIGLQFAARYTDVPELTGWLTLLTLLAVVVRMALFFRESEASLQASIEEATTDSLTGLRNRRQLMSDLATAVSAKPQPGRLRLLAMFDLDGFKAYNDAFGHPAGDALLERLGHRLEAFATGRGAAYRLGGDEFCLLSECSPGEVDGLVAGATASLSEHGDGFSITASHGSAAIPTEATSREAALQLADQRMYARKSRARASAGTQSRDVLLSVLRERRPDLHEHLADVAGLTQRLAREMELSAEQQDEVIRAAELHDVGKMAIPDAILNKPGPLDEQEWEFMRQHTVIGERIIAAAPALATVASLVRSSHERWDGSGYPDGLGEERVPLGSRMVAVCDAYEAMTSARPYQARLSPTEAQEELNRCAGTQFDPDIVASFERALAQDRSPTGAH